MSYRSLKQRIAVLLEQKDWSTALAAITLLPARQAVNPLFGLLYHQNPLTRWRAVTALGVVIAALAEKDREAARVCMRRLMWQLNDESGGIGWGAPEAMAETMARNAALAEEYASILISYMAPEGNFLEHELLQQGLLWAVGRLGRSLPHLVSDAGPLLPLYLQSPVGALRGLAAWAAGPVAAVALQPLLVGLCRDPERFTLYWDDRLTDRSVASAAEEALGFKYQRMPPGS